MQLKQNLAGRPRRTLILHVVIALAVLLLAAAAVVERDPRTGAVVVVIGAFAAREAFVLPERVSQALGVVTVLGVAAWLALVMG